MREVPRRRIEPCVWESLFGFPTGWVTEPLRVTSFFWFPQVYIFPGSA